MFRIALRPRVTAFRKDLTYQVSSDAAIRFLDRYCNTAWVHTLAFPKHEHPLKTWSQATVKHCAQAVEADPAELWLSHMPLLVPSESRIPLVLPSGVHPDIPLVIHTLEELLSFLFVEERGFLLQYVKQHMGWMPSGRYEENVHQAVALVESGLTQTSNAFTLVRRAFYRFLQTRNMCLSQRLVDYKYGLWQQGQRLRLPGKTLYGRVHVVHNEVWEQHATQSWSQVRVPPVDPQRQMLLGFGLAPEYDGTWVLVVRYPILHTPQWFCLRVVKGKSHEVGFAIASSTLKQHYDGDVDGDTLFVYVPEAPYGYEPPLTTHVLQSCGFSSATLHQTFYEEHMLHQAHLGWFLQTHTTVLQSIPQSILQTPTDATSIRTCFVEWFQTQGGVTLENLEEAWYIWLSTHLAPSVAQVQAWKQEIDVLLQQLQKVGAVWYDKCTAMFQREWRSSGLCLTTPGWNETLWVLALLEPDGQEKTGIGVCTLIPSLHPRQRQWFQDRLYSFQAWTMSRFLETFLPTSWSDKESLWRGGSVVPLEAHAYYQGAWVEACLELCRHRTQHEGEARRAMDEMATALVCHLQQVPPQDRSVPYRLPLNLGRAVYPAPMVGRILPFPAHTHICALLDHQSLQAFTQAFAGLPPTQKAREADPCGPSRGGSLWETVSGRFHERSAVHMKERNLRG